MTHSPITSDAPTEPARSVGVVSKTVGPAVRPYLGAWTAWLEICGEVCRLAAATLLIMQHGPLTPRVRARNAKLGGQARRRCRTAVQAGVVAAVFVRR